MIVYVTLVREVIDYEEIVSHEIACYKNIEDAKKKLNEFKDSYKDFVEERQWVVDELETDTVISYEAFEEGNYSCNDVEFVIYKCEVNDYKNEKYKTKNRKS